LRLKKIGNELVTLLGGREIHPINVRVGGFYRLPTREELNVMVEPLKWALDAAIETARWTARLPFPKFERDYEFVSLAHPDQYPFIEGRIVSNKGIDIPVEKFLDYFEEVHVPYSTSLQAGIKERDEYLTGPLARYHNNFNCLPAAAKKAAKDAGLGKTCSNPFKSIIVRAIETIFACHEALQIIRNYKAPEQSYIEVVPKAGTGHGASEAPRGVLYHRYTIDKDGLIKDARIIPPTSQNQRVIEADLAQFVAAHLKLPEKELTWKCEQVVRNYDPCISCSCHFLKLNVTRQ